MTKKFTILVTGGAGFMGSHLAEELIRQGHKVIVFDDLSGGFTQNIPDGAIFIKGSVANTIDVDKIFKNYKIDYIYHLAAYAAVGLSFFIKKFNYENNLIGSINLINAAVNNNVRCFVFTSSFSVYGNIKPPFNEGMIPEPDDPYAIAKLAVEQDLKISKMMWDLNYIIFRPHNVYGERQNIGDIYRNVVGIFMNQIMNGQDITIFGDGKQKRAFTYINDVIPTIANSIFNKRAYNQTFNIGSNEVHTVGELAKYLLKEMDSNNSIKFLEARKEVIEAYSNVDKAKKIFGDNPVTSFEKGIKNMAKWAKKYGSKKGKSFRDIEVKKNMPSSWLEFIDE